MVRKPVFPENNPEGVECLRPRSDQLRQPHKILHAQALRSQCKDLVLLLARYDIEHVQRVAQLFPALIERGLYHLRKQFRIAAQVGNVISA